MHLSTVNTDGLDCALFYTVNWDDGTAPSLVAVTSNDQVDLQHTYGAVGHYAVHAAASITPGSDAGCAVVPGGWDHHAEFEVLPELRSVVSLRDLDDEPLRYLSTDQHPYFKAKTLIHGTLVVRGAPEDRLTFLFLEISRDDVDTFAFLTPTAYAKLVDVPFGADRKVTVKPSDLLFELPAAQAALFADDTNGPVQLRLIGATSLDGAQITVDLPEVPRLVRYKRLNRYNGRDVARGGDDWVLPSIRPALNGLSIDFPSLLYGDISNMNGGSFDPPHKSHQDGIDVDVTFPGFVKRGPAVAAKLIAHLNDVTFGDRIARVWVTYNRPGGPDFLDRPHPDPFWLAIKDIVLTDGRKAAKVIRPKPGHDTHFHWRITP